MPIRRQIYEWELLGTGAFVAANYPIAGSEHSVFTGSFGTSIKETSLVRDTEFVVINKVSCTPGVSPQGSTASAGTLTNWVPNLMIQIVIDTTGYYRDPQNVYSAGVSGMASPYPTTIEVLPYYDLWPPVYVLSHQTWDVRYKFFNDLHAANADGFFTTIPQTTALGRVSIDYTLFTGTDALIANKLLSIGVPITIESVQWLRRLLLQSKGLETETFDFYLKVARKYREDENRRHNLVGTRPYSAIE